MNPIALMTEDEVARYGLPEDGERGFGALRCECGLLPLAAMDVDAKVAGVVASIEVAQTFVNTTGTAIEATYIFPLPDRAAVHRFRMEVAGRVIEGVIDERGAARAQYDQAIAAGHRAAITEEERPGVFTLRVGNLMPRDTATVRLTLIGPLPVDDGEVTFRFPLVVAPRYIPGHGLPGEQAGLGVAPDTDLVPDASRISPPVLLRGLPSPVRLGIRVSLADHHVRDVASSLHAVTTSKRDALLVELAHQERLDRDFVLRWRIDARELTSSLVCADDSDGTGGSFMLTLVPPSTKAVGQKPRDVVFVIDRSGSMEGWKMIAARRAAARMIDTLTSRDRVNVVAFDDRIEVVGEPTLVPATDRVRFRTIEALAKVEARGGTEIAAALAHVVATLWDAHEERERVLVLITDGQVGNEDHVLRSIAPQLRKVRVFTIGIDQAVNAGFLRRFAAIGGGLCELVESEDRLDDVMAKIHRRIGTPIVTELRVGQSDLDVVRETVSPRRLADVYAGAPVVIFGRYRGKASPTSAIALDGTRDGEPFHSDVAQRATGESLAGEASWVTPSWARAHIRDLEDRYAAGDRGLADTIVRVSKTHAVLSRFTAFVAVDRSAVVNKGGVIQQVVQPVEEPAGWQHGAPPGMPAMSMGGAVSMPAIASAVPMGMPSGGPPAMPGGMSGRYSGAPPAPAQSMPPPPPPRLAPTPKGYGAPPARRVGAMTLDRGPAREELAVDASAYLASLATLARELAVQGQGTPDLPTVKRLRQRLSEWLEDVRSVGGHDALARLVEVQLQRLVAALGAHTLAGELPAIAGALSTIAAGGAAAGSPAPSGRGEFWK